jgi:hypothetical protein
LCFEIIQAIGCSLKSDSIPFSNFFEKNLLLLIQVSKTERSAAILFDSIALIKSPIDPIQFTPSGLAIILVYRLSAKNLPVSHCKE